MAVVEHDAHGIIADRLEPDDADSLLAGHGDALLRRWPCTSALGDSTRSNSAGSAKLCPSSKVTVRSASVLVEPELGRPGVGHSTASA